jgi:transcriptional regulator with XRE-family HTH domain
MYLEVKMTKEERKRREKTLINYTGIDKDIRERRKWKHEDVVKRCQGLISIRTLQAYESGKINATAPKLMLLSDVYNVSIDSLLKRNMNPVLLKENKKIVRYEKVKDHYERNSKTGYYYLDENIKETTELGAITLDEDCLPLRLPRGTTILIDTSPSSFIIEENTHVKVMLNIKGEIYPTTLAHTPLPRHKMLFTYMNKDNRPIHITKKEIDENELILGVIKKAIIDF